MFLFEWLMLSRSQASNPQHCSHLLNTGFDLGTGIDGNAFQAVHLNQLATSPWRLGLSVKIGDMGASFHVLASQNS